MPQIKKSLTIGYKPWYRVNLQFMGSLLAAIGFSLISMTFYLYGFILGLLSTLILLGYFKNTKQIPLFYLQLFFTLVNIVGIYNQVII